MGKQFKASTKLTAKFLVVLMVLQAVLFSLTAFGATTEVQATSVTLKQGLTEAGDSIAAFLKTDIPFNVVLNGATATSTTYKQNTWTSSVGAVGSVTNVGVATTTVFHPLAKGTTKVEVTNTKSGEKDSVNITVYSKLVSFSYTTAQKATFNIQKGTYVQIPNATLLPEDADVTDTTYTVVGTGGFVQVNTTNGIDTVSGAVYGLKAGTGQVTVDKLLPDGKTHVKAIVAINVTEPVTDVTVSKAGKPITALNIDAGKKIPLTAVITPLAAKEKGVTWSLENQSDLPYLEVGVTGIVYARDAGIGKTINIKVTSKDTLNGASEVIPVTIYKGVTAITLPKSTLSMKASGTKDISGFASILPLGADVTKVTYTIKSGSTSGVAISVDKDSGLVTAGNGAGRAIILITVSVHDAVDKVLSLAVTVSPATESITVTPATKEIVQYSSYTITTAFKPTTVTYKKVEYTTSDDKVAIVNPRTGLVIGVGPGTAEITATPANGGDPKKSIVTVKAIVED